jgi:hypothetical protein
VVSHLSSRSSSHADSAKQLDMSVILNSGGSVEGIYIEDKHISTLTGGTTVIHFGGCLSCAKPSNTKTLYLPVPIAKVTTDEAIPMDVIDKEGKAPAFYIHGPTKPIKCDSLHTCCDQLTAAWAMKAVEESEHAVFVPKEFTVDVTVDPRAFESFKPPDTSDTSGKANFVDAILQSAKRFAVVSTGNGSPTTKRRRIKVKSEPDQKQEHAMNTD